MKLIELVRKMEDYANSSEMGSIDFIFGDNCIIRHTVSMSNNDRLVIISEGNSQKMSTAMSIVYSENILNLEGKFKGIDRLMTYNQGELLEEYAYVADAYCDVAENILIKSLCDDNIWQGYKDDDPDILHQLEIGNIDFPVPTIVENGVVANSKLEKESFKEVTNDLEEACMMIYDYLSDVNTIEELSLEAKTEMATGGEDYWHELKISKVFVFGELHLVMARRHCALLNDAYLNSYITKVSNPEGLGDYINGAIKDIITTCDKVSSNQNIFTVKVERTKDC